MKKRILIFISTFIIANNLVAQNKNAFTIGEELVYRIHYGIIDAGTATLSVKGSSSFNSRSTYHVVGVAETNQTFDMFFKMRDRYESYIDVQTLSPLFFYRNVDEDGYKFIETSTFNINDLNVSCKGKTFATVPNTQDMFSIFYYIRSLDLGSAQIGNVFDVSYFMTDKMYNMKVVLVGRETIKTDLGKFKCLKFNPMVEKGRVFKSEEDVIIWVTDDSRHIPIRIQANLIVGSIKCDLKKLK